jgi:hypothetical protein
LWFAKIQRDVIARGTFTSIADLSKKQGKYIRAYPRLAKPFRCTYTDPTCRIHANKIAGTAYEMQSATRTYDFQMRNYNPNL